jgi:hypothetical protein
MEVIKLIVNCQSIINKFEVIQLPSLKLYMNSCLMIVHKVITAFTLNVDQSEKESTIIPNFPIKRPNTANIIKNNGGNTTKYCGKKLSVSLINAITSGQAGLAPASRGLKPHVLFDFKLQSHTYGT